MLPRSGASVTGCGMAGTSQGHCPRAVLRRVLRVSGGVVARWLEDGRAGVRGRVLHAGGVAVEAARAACLADQLPGHLQCRLVAPISIGLEDLVERVVAVRMGETEVVADLVSE
jgi:hypothetical protein